MIGFLTGKHLCNKRWNYLIFLLFVLLIYISLKSDDIYAKGFDLPKEVIVVEDEEAMVRELLNGMKKHQTYFSFYYPGIAKDFKKYQKKSVKYMDFFDKLAQKDGYMTGIIAGSCITVNGAGVKYVIFQFGYLTTRKQEQYIDKKVRNIVKKIGKGSRVSKAKAAHNYLIQHMRYDSGYYNPYYAFSKGRGMCMSYALAYQRILQEMRIPCIYIKEKNHAWNMVKIGKYWYNVDVTWDDRGNGNRYFLKSDADFPGHKVPRSRWLDSLPRAKHSYKR